MGSLFSGVGGLELGLERAGLSVSWQCEQNAQCRQVLAEHWPNIPCHHDIRELRNVGPVDVICGGFPCQDISTANSSARKGLVGERSGLWFEMLRVIREVRPPWIVGENVTGVLSSNGGRDFGIILSGLAELGYGVAYRVLNSAFLGVNQRRRRVYIVGHLGDGRASQVLLEPKDVREVPKQSRRKWEADPSPATSSTSPRVVAWHDRRVELTVHEQAYTLLTNPKESGVCYGETIRFLTPTESARMQGFPDDWGARGVLQTSDRIRYRQFGNAVTVNVAEWIGNRLLEASV